MSRRPQASPIKLYSLVNYDAFAHDPRVEKYIADIFPPDQQDFDPVSANIPLSELQVDSDNPQDGSFRPGSISMPPIELVLPEARRHGSLPQPLMSLHMLQHELAHKGISAIEFYSIIRANEPLLHAYLPPRAHVDGGAMGATSQSRRHLWYYRDLSDSELSRTPKFKVADGTLHLPVGLGFLKIPLKPPHSFVFVKTFYTPGIPATIISPDALAKALGCLGYTAVSDFVEDSSSLHLTECAACNSTVIMPLTRIQGLLYTDSLVTPTESEHLSPMPTTLDTVGCNVISSVLLPPVTRSLSSPSRTIVPPVIETVCDDDDNDTVIATVAIIDGETSTS